jgi:hypothetical protein
MCAVLSLGGCGSSGAPGSGSSSTAGAPLSLAAPPAVKGAAGGLAIGLTEGNANLLLAPPHPVAAGFEHARGLLAAMAPGYLRVLVDWAALEPTPNAAPMTDRTQTGCSRTAPPCGAYAGIDAELRAIASRSSAPGGAPQVVMVLFDTPAWAARTPSGCERAGATAGARPATAAGLQAYRKLVLALLALGDRDGVQLRWWSAWDEPNQPLFIGPQRAACDSSSPALAPNTYASLVRTLAGALRSAGGTHEIVLGDLADIPNPRPQAIGIEEFVHDLPEDVLCLSDVWAQHEYPKTGKSLARANGDSGDVKLLERALDARGSCGRRARIWVTETGVGNAHNGGARLTTPAALAASCRLMSNALGNWYRDPRVDVAFQYSFREDPLFPVGLLSPDLSRVYPTYDLLKAWAGSRQPAAAAPAPPAGCA